MLEEVKNYLAITWSDDITDSNVQRSIDEGIAYLSELVGTAIDFDNDKEARALLKDYCRYVRNYSLEYFETNFLQRILRLQIRYATSESKTSSI